MKVLFQTTVMAAGALLGACAGRADATNSPQRCMSACESDCPGKGGSGHEFEKYLSCLDRCEVRCGLREGDDGPAQG